MGQTGIFPKSNLLPMINCRLKTMEVKILIICPHLDPMLSRLCLSLEVKLMMNIPGFKLSFSLKRRIMLEPRENKQLQQ